MRQTLKSLAFINTVLLGSFAGANKAYAHMGNKPNQSSKGVSSYGSSSSSKLVKLTSSSGISSVSKIQRRTPVHKTTLPATQNTQHITQQTPPAVATVDQTTAQILTTIKPLEQTPSTSTSHSMSYSFEQQGAKPKTGVYVTNEGNNTPPYLFHSFNKRPLASTEAFREKYSRTPGAPKPKGPIVLPYEGEVSSVLSSVKESLKKDNYTVIPKLRNSLKFMGHSKDDFKKTISSLTEEDFYKVRHSNPYGGNTFVFERNKDEDEKKIYVKFSFNKNTDDLTFISYHNSDIKDELNHDDSKDISKILNSPGFIKLDLLGRSIDKVLNIVKPLVVSGDYSKHGRVKESLIKIKFRTQDFRRAVLNLDKKNYLNGPMPDKNMDSDDDIPIWTFAYYDTKLNTDIYIKFILKENTLKFLSFHPVNNKIRYPLYELDL